MSTNEPPFTLVDFDLLEKEYPGISRIQQKLISVDQNNLIKLTNLIKYNIPKHYYSQQIQSFAHFLQEKCLDSLLAQTDFDENQILPAQMHRTHSPISDEEEAEVIKQIKQQIVFEPSKFSIVDFQRYIQNYQITQALKVVNPKIIDAVSQLQNAKTEKSVFQNFEHRQKTQRKSVYTKQSSFKSKDTPRKNDNRSQKQEISITMGDKIPLQVKQMKNYVKAASLQSFAISSIQSEQKKSQIQKYQQQISLALNKVAKQNIFDIFVQIKSLATEKYQLSLFLVDQILNKCLLQFRMIPVYLEFLCMFTKIPQKQFDWRFNELKGKNHKMNSIHCLLTQKLEHEFKEALNTEKSKQLKSLGAVIGFLVQKRILSKQIYLDASSLLLQNITRNCSQEFMQEHENYFESQLCLVQSLGQKYDQIWEQYQLQQVMCSQTKTMIYGLLNNKYYSSLQQLLIALNEVSKFPTARVKCLIQNIFERKLKGIKIQLRPKEILNNLHDEMRDKVHQLLREENGIKQALQFYQSNKKTEILYLILLAVFDGTQAQIKLNMESFTNSNKVSEPQFRECLQNNIVDLMYEQCDLPFLVSGFSLFMLHYMGGNAKAWHADIGQEDPDYQDTKAFVDKIIKKIKYYQNSSDRQICHQM